MKFLAASTTLLLLSASLPATATCPAASDYALNPPTLLGSYAPVSPSCPGGSTNSPCGDHRVYAPSDLTTLQTPLLVFLPGTSMEPDKHDLVLKMAAYAGYRTIGLSYDNVNSLASLCGGTLCTDECHYKVRGERITGADLTPVVTTRPADSVVVRLHRLLVQLQADDLLDGVDDWGWGTYFTPVAAGQTPTRNDLHWDQMVVAGFSQGSGHAALISMQELVEGLVLLEGAHDMCDDGTGTSVMATYCTNPNASAGQPRFGALHRRGAAVATIPGSWTTLGLSATDHDVDSTALPLTTTVASTDQAVPGAAICSEHMSMARDGCMPTDTINAVSTSSPDAVHLFLPYFEMFCSL